MCFSTPVSATTFAACCLQVLHAVLPHACVAANPKAGPFAGMRSFHKVRQAPSESPPRAMVLPSPLSKGFGMPCSKRVKSTKVAPW